MNYGEFKENLISGLSNFYGGDAEISIVTVPKYNGQSYEGVQIRIASTRSKCEVIPVINMEDLFAAYSRGELADMNDCVEAVYRIRERSRCCEGVVDFAAKIQDWEYVKEQVYPILLPTKNNTAMLENLVSLPILDLSIVYIIRGEFQNNDRGMVKVSKALLDCYGITGKELHEQALKNLEQDGYTFWDMGTFLRKEAREFMSEERQGKFLPSGKMHLLTNSAKCYGAAGILDRKLLRRFAGKRNFFILPSFIHETLFVPADSGVDRARLDNMVMDVNAMVLDQAEYLSDHSYFYDGELGVIQMCA